MKMLKKIGWWVLDCLVLAGLGAIFYFSYQFSYGAFANEPMGSDEEYKVNVVVEEGDSVEEVAKNLYSLDLIRSEKQFLFRNKLSEYDGKIKAGSYELNPTMGIDDILQTLTQTETTQY